MLDAADEMFDVVDEHDVVVGRRSRSEVHALDLIHRAVSVFVFNSRRELLIQKRSAAKDQYPLCYTSSASGHVAAGDTYADTAARELEEELGLRLSVRFVHQFPVGPETACEHTALYEVQTDEPPIPDADEIAALSWWTLSDLVEAVQSRPQEFTPPFRVMLRWYVAERRQVEYDGVS